jgi:hypothetical protein
MTTVIPARMSQILGTVQGTIAHIIFQTQHLVVFSMMKHLMPQMYAAPVEEAWSTMMEVPNSLPALAVMSQVTSLVVGTRMMLQTKVATG